MTADKHVCPECGCECGFAVEEVERLEAALSVERIERGLDSLYTYRENHLAAATLRAALLQNDSPLSHNAEKP